MPNEVTNYIEDDWDDNALTGRTNPEKGHFFQYSDGGTGDLLKGVYRPRWVKRGESFPTVTGGELYFDIGGLGNNGVSMVLTPSDFSVGQIKMDFQYETLGSSGDSVYQVFRTQPLFYQNDAIVNVIRDSNDSTIDFRKYVGGTSTNIISIKWSTDTNVHTTSTTRDSYGNFEIFIDGTSLGTGQDKFFPADSPYIGTGVNDGSGSSVITVDNYIVQ